MGNHPPLLVGRGGADPENIGVRTIYHPYYFLVVLVSQRAERRSIAPNDHQAREAASRVNGELFRYARRIAIEEVPSFFLY